MSSHVRCFVTGGGALQLGPVTVLIGANGAGKSNFVNFFTMLNYALSGSLQLYVGRKGGAQALLHYGSKRTPVLNAELQFQGPQATSHYRFALAHSAGDRFIYTHEEVEFLREGHRNPFLVFTDLQILEGQYPDGNVAKSR